jgi:hypothetical protein
MVMAAFGLLLAGSLSAQEEGLAGYSRGFSLSLSPNAIMPVKGRYADHASMAKAAPFGMGLELGINYRMFRYLSLSLTAVENWIPIAQDYKTLFYQGQSPAFLLPALSLSAIVHMAVGFPVEPYVRLGGGVSPWRFSGSGFTGETWQAPSRPGNEFSNLSPEMHVGFGIETLRFGRFAVLTELRYTYVFTRDPAKFGTDDFTEQDFLSLHIGLTLHLN